MNVEQISIFIENKSGRLAEVTGVLSSAGVNIRALSLAETSDFGILRLIVSDTDKAFQELRQSGFTVTKTEVIAVEVPDKPGGLAGILNVLKNAGINVEYMYAFVQRSGEHALVVFRFDEPAKAGAVLAGSGIRILDGNELYAM